MFTLTQADDIRVRLARNPLPKPVQANWDEAERVKGVYSSNAIEGSTLTLGETEAVLRGATVPGKELHEHFAAVNLNLAWTKMDDWAKGPIGERLLLDIHQILLARINDDQAGRYRTVRVRIVGSEHIAPNPASVPEKMETAFAAFSELRGRHPIEQAADLHADIVTIHPFSDGNGRSARLIQNIALIKAGFWPINIPVTERARYIEATYQSNTGNMGPYREYIVEKVVASGQDRLAMVE
jgi:Fic family protein